MSDSYKKMKKGVVHLPMKDPLYVHRRVSCFQLGWCDFAKREQLSICHPCVVHLLFGLPLDPDDDLCLSKASHLRPETSG